ncbi:unnamed protein product [Lathyrus sativus]|nr:unnamed protein product [Lathyrus sativus]
MKNVGKTLVSCTQGSKVSLADLQGDEEHAFRKISLRTENVQGKNLLTNFWGMSLTTDKLRSLIRRKMREIMTNQASFCDLKELFVLGIGGIIAQTLEEQIFRWFRAAELTCDRAALLIAQDLKVVIFVLMKLAGGCPSLADQLNVDAFL